MTAPGLLEDRPRAAGRGDVASVLRYAKNVHPSGLSDVPADLDEPPLSRVGVDPPVASSVFVTPVTDACGFLLPLTLASWLRL